VRRHPRILAAIALVALAAFAVLLIGVRTPLARGMVAGWIEDAARLPATVESLGLGFFPSPSVRIGGLAIAQPPGFGDEPFVTVSQVRLRIPWSGIFNISEVETISASDATVRLVVNPDGTANWSKLGGEPVPGATAPAAEPVRGRGGARPPAPGTVDYRDLAAGSHAKFTGITLTANDIEPGQGFPFDLKLGGIFESHTTHLAVKGQCRIDTAAGQYAGSALEFRGWLGGEPLPLAGAELVGTLGRVTYVGASGVASAADGRFEFAEAPGRFEGRIDFGEPVLSASFAVTTEAFAPRRTAIILGKPLPATTDPAAFESLQLALTASLQDGVLRLDPVTGRLDDTNFEAGAVPAERFVRAKLDRIDLDRYLPAAAKATPGTNAAPGKGAAPAKESTLEATVAELAKLDLDAEIRVEEARVAGATLRDAVIRVERVREPLP
jgi:AsmA protein